MSSKLIDLNDSAPAAPAGGLNGRWQAEALPDDPSVPRKTSVYVPPFGASGAGHAPGLVPDPGASAGSARFLREDGGWAVPTGGGGVGSAYSSVVLANSPDAYYRMGEISGHFADSSGHGYDTTSETASIVRGLTGVISGDSDLSAYFASSSSNKIVTPSTIPTFGSAFSVEAWFNLIGFPTHGGILGRDSTGSGVSGNDAAFYFKYTTAGSKKPTFTVVYGSATTVTATGPLLLLGQRYHMVGTYDATDGNIRLYLNGKLVATTSLAGHTIVPQSGPFNIGCEFFSRVAADFSDAIIDEVAIYCTQALSAATVADHYAAGV